MIFLFLHNLSLASKWMVETRLHTLAQKAKACSGKSKIGVNAIELHFEFTMS